MIVYKVVRVDGEELKSAVKRIRYRAGRRSCVAQLTYIPGEVTTPSFGKIFAFNSRDAAYSWASFLLAKAQIWEAETSEAEPIARIPGDGENFLLSKFKHFWRTGAIRYGSMEAPEGTVVCPELTLIQRVEALPR